MFTVDHLLMLACASFSIVAIGTVSIEVRAYVRRLRYRPRHAQPLRVSYAEDAEDTQTISWLEALPAWDDRRPAPATAYRKRGALRILTQPLRPVAIARAQQATLLAVGWYASLALTTRSALELTTPWSGADDVWPEWRPWNV